MILEFLIGAGLGYSVGYGTGHRDGYKAGVSDATALCENTYVTGGGEVIIKCGELRGHSGRHFPRKVA